MGCAVPRADLGLGEVRARHRNPVLPSSALSLADTKNKIKEMSTEEGRWAHARGTWRNSFSCGLETCGKDLWTVLFSFFVIFTCIQGHHWGHERELQSLQPGPTLHLPLPWPGGSPHLSSF